MICNYYITMKSPCFASLLNNWHWTNRVFCRFHFVLASGCRIMCRGGFFGGFFGSSDVSSNGEIYGEIYGKCGVFHVEMGKSMGKIRSFQWENHQSEWESTRPEYWTPFRKTMFFFIGDRIQIFGTEWGWFDHNWMNWPISNWAKLSKWGWWSTSRIGDHKGRCILLAMWRLFTDPYHPTYPTHITKIHQCYWVNRGDWMWFLGSKSRKWM